MLSSSLQSLFLEIVEQHTGQKAIIERTTSLSGGSINDALRIHTNHGCWFAKYNDAQRFPQMFEKEAMGLRLLHKAGEIHIPAVAGWGEKENKSMLVLEYVEGAREIKNFWQHFGRNLAGLHRHTSLSFGLDHNNYIGSLAQHNDPADNWIDFFINMRLQEQIKLARNHGRLDSATVKKFEKLFPYLPDFFPQEKPSLLHGDLWSGNFITNDRGEACIIDPAIYYGHRIMDLGMSKLFGGFAPAFYDSYKAEFPLENNWQQAVEIANLYPLLVHVNLFGAGYLGSVQSILRRF